MSENEVQADEALLGVDQTEDDYVPPSDWLLREVVDLVNDTHMELGITLSTPSGIVSGNLISLAAYLDQIDKDLGQAKGDASSLKALFDNVREQLPHLKNYPNYLHLKDTVFLLGGNQSIPANGGVLWRGKISDITGYTFGKTVVK